MLLTQAHGPQLPVRHLLSLANFKGQHLFCHLSQPGLLACDVDLAVVGLGVDEVAHVLVEVHPRQMLCEYIHIRLERKPNVDRLFMSKKFR